MGKTYTRRANQYQHQRRDRDHDAPDQPLRNTERARPQRQPMGFSSSRELKRSY